MSGFVASAPSANVVALPPLPSGWQVLTYTVLADGALTIVGTDVDFRAELRPDETGGALGDPVRLAATARAKLWIFDGDTLADGPSFGLERPFPVVDRFPDGRWLVVSTRAWDQANARILSPKGELLNRVRLGDGIEQLKIDATGHVWVGWFDEGIFGSAGWRIPDLEWPPSSYGLAAFDDQGNVVAHADAVIAGCDALNVIDGAAYAACTDTHFSIIAAAVGAPARMWSTSLGGIKAIAVELPYVLTAGGFAGNGDRAILMRLGQDRGEVIGEWRLPFPVGCASADGLVDGRADVLHVVQNNLWHRWRTSDFPSDSSAPQSPG